MTRLRGPPQGITRGIRKDPKGKSLERVREIRDDARTRVMELLEREGWRSPGS